MYHWSQKNREKMWEGSNPQPEFRRTRSGDAPPLPFHVRGLKMIGICVLSKIRRNNTVHSIFFNFQPPPLGGGAAGMDRSLRGRGSVGPLRPGSAHGGNVGREEEPPKAGRRGEGWEWLRVHIPSNPLGCWGGGLEGRVLGAGIGVALATFPETKPGVWREGGR